MSEAANSGGFSPPQRKETTMNRIVRVLVLLVFGVVAAFPLSSLAQEKVKTAVIMKAGNTVNLFYSGTENVRKLICLNDVIPVYRETTVGYVPTKEVAQPKALKEVGKVRVVSYIGDHYFQAKVVEGTIQVGDIAKKEGAYCLVQPAK
jgi:hypothetical protein